MCRVLGLVLIITTPTALAAVNRCLDDGGRLHFSQFDCPEGTLPAPGESEHTAPLSIVVTPPLSQAESRALARLELALERERAVRARARERAARAQARRSQESAALCSEARQKLEALAATRRKGYSAAAESRLEAEEDHWRAAKRAAC